MKPVRQKSISSVVIVSSLLMIFLGGCLRSGMKIIPFTNQHVMELTADETIQIMKAAGYSNEQIQKYGWSVRDGLAKSGAVRIMKNSAVTAGFAVRGDEIYISSRSTGRYIFNVNTQQLQRIN